MGRFDQLEEFLGGLEERGISGCTCLIKKDGKEVFRQYAGLAQRERAIRPAKETIYRLYSITKMITAIVILKLCEEKKLFLDEPAEEVLPEFSGTHITLRHLLTMQSGLSYPMEGGGQDLADVRKRIEGFRKTHIRYTTREYAAMLAQTPRLQKPGTGFLYGTGYDVLAAIAEEISGISFGTCVQRLVTGPLKMKHTKFKWEPEERERVAGLYSFDGTRFYKHEEKDGVYSSDFPFEEGGGGLLTTADDLMSFSEMFLRDGKTQEGAAVISRESLSIMTANSLDTEKKQQDYARRFSEPDGDGWTCPYGYGMGVRVRLADGGKGDSPKGEFGWYGMSGNYLLIDRKNQLAVVYMESMLPGREKEIHPILRKLIYRAII